MNKLSDKKLIFLATFLFIVFLLTPRANAFTVVLDPGHGGKDSGASSGGLTESDLTMKIARYLKDYLDDYEGVNVILTHNGETMSLEDRADFARNNGADLMVSIHINSSSMPIKHGVEVYVTYRTDLPKYNAQMTELGNKVLANIAKLGITNNGVATKIVKNEDGDPEYKYFDGSNGDYYAIIRRSMKGGHATDLGDDFRDGSGVSVILVEHAYLSNSGDREYLNSDDKLRALAKADCDAIVSQYGLVKNEAINVTEYLFNATYYADMNSDLKAAFGYNESLLFNHYKNCGIAEGRTASPVYDGKYYLNANSDLKAAFGNNYTLAYNHFINCGAKEGRESSEFFDGKYYLNSNGDLQAAFNSNYTKAIRHFMCFGANEGRNGSSKFDVKNYYNSCSSYVKSKLGNNYLKYYAYSKGANVVVDDKVDISGYLFNAEYYYNAYPDLQAAFGYNPELLRNHFYSVGLAEGRSGSAVFDAKYYLSSNGDLQAAFGNNYTLAYNHFISNGINEGRRGSAQFDVKYYLDTYGDLSSIFGANYSKALSHFVNYGINEGRTGSKWI